MIAVVAVAENLRGKPARPEEIKLFKTVENLAPELWQDLEKRPLKEICAGSGVNFEPGQGFLVPYMGGAYLVNLDERTVSGPPQHRPPDFQRALTLVRYLTTAQDFGQSGRQVTGQELTGGDLFFRGPHALLTEPVTDKFGGNPDDFMKKAATLGFQPAEPPQSWSCLGLILPHLSLGLILHPEDDEFPAELTYTFDSYAHYHLPLDAVWSMINDLAQELAN